MKKQCRICILHDDNKELRRSIDEYIDVLDPSVKTPAEAYIERLKICESCKCLMNGTCRICGCFAEVRAAISKNSCPHVEKFW